MENKEIEDISLLITEIIGYANGVMVDKVDTRMCRYFNEKASEAHNKIDKALRELQPLERIPEETRPTIKGDLPVERISNKTRPTGEEELKKKISEIFIKWGLPTRQIAINEILEQLSLAREEGRKEIISGVRMLILAMPPQIAKNGENLANSILTLLDSLTNQSKENEPK